MDANFYKSILPPACLRVLAVFKGGLKSPPTHIFYDNDDDFLAAAETYDRTGKNVYHACAAYKTDASRKGDNVAAVKSLWIDLDVGGNKPYAAQRDAAADVERFIHATGLPTSHTVSSGSGVHSYFAFTKPILPDQWDRLAAIFAACLDHFGVKHDTSRTQDKASILRIPGTQNYKTNPAKNVRLVRQGTEAPAADIYAALKAYADANGIIVGAVVPKNAPLVRNDLMGAPTEYPPSDGFLIAETCPVLTEVQATGGDVPYEVWWRAMGVAKFTKHPELTATNWTASRATTGHEKNDWKTIIATWPAGPTTCAEFSKHSAKCAGCGYNGKIKSPIQLGVDEQPAVTALPAVEDGDDGAPEMPKEWTFGAEWIMDAKAKATRTGYANGKITMSKRDEGGVMRHVPFCNTYWQVMRRIRTAEGVWQLEIGYLEYPGKPHKTFLIDSAAVMSPDKLRTEFSARELHIYGDKNAMFKAQQMIMSDQEILKGYQQETRTYPTMGWVTENGTARGDLTGEFVVGSTIIRPKRKAEPVLLDDTVDMNLRSNFGCKGSTSEWTTLIDHIYNRPGAEAYQFVIAAMFAAPLVKLVPGEGDWHGIPVSLVGDSGAAKTSTALAAMSLYAPPQLLRFNAQNTKEGQGDTTNALSIKLGALNSLPFIMDEMTGLEATTVSGIMYMLSNGKIKDRMGPNGRMIPNPYRWDTLSITTSNDSLHEVLRRLRNQNTQDASQLRCFEIALKADDMTKVFNGVNKTLVEKDLLAEQYGHAGRDWLQFVVDNRVRISEKLGQTRKVYKIEEEDKTNIRFYKDLLITVHVAALLAKRRGFILWDVDKMMTWARRHLSTLRVSVMERDWEGTISDFVASLHGRTIVTKHMSLGRGRRSTKNLELPLEPLTTSHPPLARKAIDDRVFVVTANALNAWANENRIMPSALIDAMVSKGYVLLRDGGKAATRLINIGSGSTITRPQAPCWELDFTRIGQASGSDEDGDDGSANVVELRPTPQVTDPVTDAADTTEKSTVSP